MRRRAPGGRADPPPRATRRSAPSTPSERAATTASAIAAGWPQTSSAVAPAAARAQDLRREIGRARGDLDPGGDRLGVLGERPVERRAARAPVAGVVGQERDLQLLRDEVLGEAGTPCRGSSARCGRRSAACPGRRGSRRRRRRLRSARAPCSAIFQAASTPVPSLTIATACCRDRPADVRDRPARRARRCRRSTTLKSTIPPGTGTPRCAVASRTPFAIVVPMYASRLNGRVDRDRRGPRRRWVLLTAAAAGERARPRSRTGRPREPSAAFYATPSAALPSAIDEHAVGDGPHELEVVLDEDERDAALRTRRRISASRGRSAALAPADGSSSSSTPRPRGERRGEHQQPLLEAVERARRARAATGSSPTVRSAASASPRVRAASRARLRRRGDRAQRARCRARAARLRRRRSRARSGCRRSPCAAGCEATPACARAAGPVAGAGARRRGSRPRRARARRRGRAARSSCPSRSRRRARPPRRARRRGRSRRARGRRRRPSPGRGREIAAGPGGGGAVAERQRQPPPRQQRGRAPGSAPPGRARARRAGASRSASAGAAPARGPGSRPTGGRRARSRRAWRRRRRPAAAYPAPPSSTATSRRNDVNGPNAFGSETPASCTASAPASPATVEETTNAPKRSESPRHAEHGRGRRAVAHGAQADPGARRAEDREQPDGDRGQPERELVVRRRPERRGDDVALRAAREPRELGGGERDEPGQEPGADRDVERRQPNDGQPGDHGDEQRRRRARPAAPPSAASRPARRARRSRTRRCS